MLLADQLRFNWQVFDRHRVRTGLMLLSVAIGVAAVILLTSLGEGARRYVNNEFASIGSRLLIVFPGRSETTGGHPPVFGNSPRDLTLGDAEAIGRVPTIDKVAPVVVGNANVSAGNISRDTTVIGSTAEFLQVREISVSHGKNLPTLDSQRGGSVCVLGYTLKQELFGHSQAVGQWVRIGDRRMRVIGVIADVGQSVGMNMNELAMVPVQTAQQLFDSPGLFRVMLQFKERVDIEKTKQQVLAVVRERHEGEEDVTLVSQDSVIESFNNILGTLTLAIGAIGAIGLLVAGVLIMNISLISVSQRRKEIGLLKAIGSSSLQVRNLFLAESLMLVGLGSLVGIVIAYLLVWLMRQLWPVFPMMPPVWAAPTAVLIAVCSGLLFSWLPARKASALDPVLALRGQEADP